MKQQRPVNLDLSTMRFPITAIASILHRISGVVIFLLIPLLLCGLSLSLASEQGFAQLVDWFSKTPVKLFLWLCLSALVYHLVAGFRHLLMDFGVGENHCGGRLGARLVFVITILIMAWLGWALW